MPPFRASLNDSQIESLANYVRSHFGRIASSLDAQKVATILNDKIDAPWFIQNALWLAISAIVSMLIWLMVIVGAIILVCGRRRHAAATE